MNKELKEKIIKILNNWNYQNPMSFNELAKQILELFEEEKPAECLDDMARAIGQIKTKKMKK